MNNWESIKQSWKSVYDNIAQGKRISPYFHEWHFTPIEEEVWNEIRFTELPLYPQVPVKNMFVDFGNPFLKIGIESDGKEWHELSKDIKRDKRLKRQGWTIYHLTGSECKRLPKDYENKDEAYLLNSVEGLLTAIAVIHFSMDKAYGSDIPFLCKILEKHLLIKGN